MKWVLSQQSLDHHRWLLQDAKDQAQITYNHEHYSIRIKSTSSRLFFLQVSGLFQKKMQLRSEYGVIVGEAPLLPEQSKGWLQVNEEKYYYKWHHETLLIFSKDKLPLHTIPLEGNVQLNRFEKFALLFSSVWLINTTANRSNKENVLVA